MNWLLTSFDNDESIISAHLHSGMRKTASYPSGLAQTQMWNQHKMLVISTICRNLWERVSVAAGHVTETMVREAKG